VSDDADTRTKVAALAFDCLQKSISLAIVTFNIWRLCVGHGRFIGILKEVMGVL